MTVYWKVQRVAANTASSNSFQFPIEGEKGSKLVAVTMFPPDAGTGPIYATISLGDIRADNVVRLAQGFCRQDGSNLAVDAVHWDGEELIDSVAGLPILRGFANNNTGTNTFLQLNWAISRP